MKRVLVIQLARLGDLAQSLPLLLGLKHAGCRVDLISSLDPGDWLRERLDALLVLDPRSLEQELGQPAALFSRLRGRLSTLLAGVGPEGWDHLVCLNESPVATGLAELLPARQRHGAGVPGDPYACWLAALAEGRRPNLLHLSEMMLATLPWVEGQATAARPCDSRDLILHPGSGSPFRRLETRFWRGLLRELALALPEHRLLLTGGASEQALCDELARGLHGVRSLAGRTGLDELLSLIEGAALVIAQDTGVLHLAAATHTPVLGLYHGSARARETGPFQHGAHLLQIVADCHPCAEGHPTCADRDCARWIHFHDTARVALALVRGETPPAPADPRVALWRCEFEPEGWLLKAPDGSAPEREHKGTQLAFLRGEATGEALVEDPRAWAAARSRGLDPEAWQRRAGFVSPLDLKACAAHYRSLAAGEEIR